MRRRAFKKFKKRVAEKGSNCQDSDHQARDLTFKLPVDKFQKLEIVHIVRLTIEGFFHAPAQQRIGSQVGESLLPVHHSA